MWLPEGGELAAALVNAIVLALWAALPVLILGYIRQARAARRIRPEFALRKSEIVELGRAVALYDQVCRRLEGIEQQAQTPTRFWRALFDRTDDGGEADAEERDDLLAHAQHLRGTIARLKRRPLQRLHAWVHAASAQSALAGAIAAYGAALALVIAPVVAASQAPGQAAWADELNAGARHSLAWYPLDARLFYANAAAAGFAVAAAALFYLLRRARLRRDYELEIYAFRDLADSDPRRPAEPAPEDQAAFDPSQWTEANENSASDTWFAVLGLSPAATIEDVRNAYKTLIKQNHPDRVHDMAPVFRAFAEAETKKINAAYRQALLCIPQAESCAA
jgi:DnaJ-domain-containing protein 1